MPNQALMGNYHSLSCNVEIGMRRTWSRCVGGNPDGTHPGGEGPAEEVFERFLHGEQVSQSVRPVILRSWRRCQELAGPPDKLGFPDPVEADPNSYLIRMAGPVLDRVRPIVDHADAAVLLVDGQATLVLRYLADPQMTRFFDKVGAVVGTNYPKPPSAPTAPAPHWPRGD